MEEEIKKRGRGRPRKGEVVPPKPKRRSKVGRPPKKHSGGAREGAGRKPMENARNQHFSFRVSERAVRQANALRELTKRDDKTFVDMLEDWIAEQAENYGIE